MGVPNQSKQGFKLKTLPTTLMLTIGIGIYANALAQSNDNVTQLDNVVVSATGFEQLIEDAPASISVIPREEIEKKAFKDVTDVLKDVPGVVLTGGGSSSDISIRGMAPAYTMILIDGKRQNSRETRPNSDGPGIEQGWMPPMEAIERIEVIRGPMSSLYGSDAMGGVVNIITRKVPGKWTGSIRTEGTLQADSKSGDMYQGNFYLAGPIVDDTLGIALYGQKSHRAEDKIYGGFNRQDTESGGLKLSLSANKDHDFVVEASRTIQKRKSTPGKSVDYIGGNGRPTQLSDTHYYQNRYSLTHHGRWGAATSETYVQQEKTNNPTRDMFLKTDEFNTQWNLPLGNHIVSAGFNYKKENLKDDGNEFSASTTNRLSRYQWALFAEDEWMITDDFSLTTGVRMTKDENFGTHWTPRMYGVWHATDNLSFKGGISTGFKAPGLRQTVADWGQATGGPGGNAIIMGNPNLKPEKSISQEFGIVWDNRENWNSSLTFFNTTFKDKISEVRECSNGACTVKGSNHLYRFVSSRVNVDKAIMRGVEATSTWNITDDVRWTANYTYTYSKQKTGQYSGKPLNKMPKHMFNSTVDWDINEKASAWTRLNYRGKTSEYLSRVDMADGTPSFTFVDVGFNYKINKNVSAGIAAYNVFNKRVDAEKYDATYDGRRYWASLTVKF